MRSHTIGEVLQRLKDEFDDITISKIRFLESEGLISPGRTDSGYRKFDDGDVDRLRYVLRAQRDRYLPLRVIRGELDRIDAGMPVAERPADPDPTEVAALRGDGGSAADGAQTPTGTAGGTPTERSAELGDLLAEAPGENNLTLTQLAEATGLETRELQSLRDHGLLAGEHTFDADDLQVARVAATLFEAGLEARHLRMYRQFADRELALCEQLVSALLRQRNPDSRRTATDQVERLVSGGAQLHKVLLTRSLRGLLGT